MNFVVVEEGKAKSNHPKQNHVIHYKSRKNVVIALDHIVPRFLATN